MKEDNSGHYDAIERGEEMECLEMKGIIGKLIADRLLISCKEFESEDNAVNQAPHAEHFPIEIEDAIRNRRVVAVVNASVDEWYMAESWVIASLDNKMRCHNNIYSTK